MKPSARWVAAVSLAVALSCSSEDRTETAVTTVQTADESTTRQPGDGRPLVPSVTAPPANNDMQLSALEYEGLVEDPEAVAGLFENSHVLRERAVAEAAGRVVCEMAQLKFDGFGDHELFTWVETLSEGVGSPSPSGDALAIGAVANRMCADLHFLVENDWYEYARD